MFNGFKKWLEDCGENKPSLNGEGPWNIIPSKYQQTTPPENKPVKKHNKRLNTYKSKKHM